MSKPVIEVRNLSKRYRLGAFGASTLREELTARLGHLFRRRLVPKKIRGSRDSSSPESVPIAQPPPPSEGVAFEENEFWALRDVSFDIQQGEVLGVIGRNGAGKSTLLKILSRITEPTSGEATIRGRIASLLEVGTGFHPELTGRENIFINGAILGMKRSEIEKKFDEIVAFAEIDQFIETPVKRYSSGMYVRLAFAVAAHLEPEILIVDEVLAVGDLQFQKRCLGKMQDIARGGRTVLFVSHNMDAILRLCSKGILLENGRVILAGSAAECVQRYSDVQAADTGIVDLTNLPRGAEVRSNAAFLTGKSLGDPDQPEWRYSFGSDVAIELVVRANQAFDDIEVAVGLFANRGFEIASWISKCSNGRISLKPGLNTLNLHYREICLLPGHYNIGIALKSEWGNEDYIPEAIRFEILRTPESAAMHAEGFGGVMIPRIDLKVIS